MAIIYGDLGQFGLSIEKQKNVIKLANTLNNKEQLAQAYSNLSYFYKSLGNYTEAQSNNFNALKIYEDLKDKYGNMNSSLDRKITLMDLLDKLNKDYNYDLTDYIKLLKETKYESIIKNNYNGTTLFVFKKRIYLHFL
jgi:tetratricopeptide (TPR) repeat protein